MAATQQTGVVNIRGKEYYTVAKRIDLFRKEYPKHSIETELVESGSMVVMKATIRDDSGNLLSTGYAEEERGSTNINSTSALENAETSAVGRALAFFEFAGTEIASADEVVDAMNQQDKKAVEKAIHDKWFKFTAALIANYVPLMNARDYIAAEDYEAAIEQLDVIGEEDREALNHAFTKGGFWTTQESAIFKTNEYAAAKRNFYQLKEQAKNDTVR